MSSNHLPDQETILNEAFLLFVIPAFKYHLQKKGLSHAGGR